MVLLRSGLRVGELCGLTWNDVDEKAGLLHVRRNLVFFKDQDAGKCRFIINDGKTVAALRDIPLTDELKEMFDIQRESGAECRQTIDGVTDFVFVNRFGDVQHQGTLNKALKRIVKHANDTAGEGVILLPQFSCHTLRHTFCTNLIKGGVELTAASALMGHRDIQTTANIYNDVQQEQKEKAMDQMTAYARRIEAHREVEKKNENIT